MREHTQKVPCGGFLRCGILQVMKNRIIQKTLPNGMPIVIAELPGHSTVTVLQMVACGMYYETAETNGISHFLEHVCFKGTKNWDGRDLMKYLDGLGAETNAFTSEEFTGYYAKGAAANWREYIAAVSDIYQHPVFPTDEVVRERGVVLGEYDMYEDQPTYQAQKLLSTAMFGNQPAGWQVIGTKKNISSFKDTDVAAWHDKYYTPANSVLIVAGPVAASDVMTAARRHYAGKARTTRRPRRVPVTDRQTAPVVMARTADTDQTHVCIAFRGYNRNSPDRQKVQLLASLLGAGMSSRLYVKLREDMGAGYYVTAAHVAYMDHGYFEIRTGCEASRVAEVVAAIRAECDRLVNELVTTAELEKTTNYLVGHSYMGLESTDAWAEYVGVQALLDGKILTIEDRLANLRAITPAQLRTVARKLFRDDQMTVVAYGNVKQSDLKKGLK